MRYGSPNAGVGPGGGAGAGGFDSESVRGRGEAMAATLGEGDGALVSGGGSIDACEVASFEGITGSGSCGISSSVRVSIVISLVSTLAERI